MPAVTAGSSASGGSAGAAGEIGSAGELASAGEPGLGDAGAASGGAPSDSDCPEQSPSCAVLRAALLHRYSFNGEGTQVPDSIGSADATVIGTELTGSGSLVLAGGDTEQYVDLPNGIVSSLQSATFEAWLTWGGGNSWQRIFDFGVSEEGEDVQGIGQSYLFLTPLHGGDPGSLRLAYTSNGNTNEVIVDANESLPMDTPSHVAAVVDSDNSQVSLYLDGAFQASNELSEPLSAINDVNNWLGRSQFVADDELSGTLDEFRIYGAALSSEDIRISYAAGPDFVLAGAP